MSKPQSPIHRPLDEVDLVPAPPSVPSSISRLAALDQYVLARRTHSLGPGGVSSIFSRAIEKALIDEIAEQLREGPFETQNGDSEIRKWAGAIIEAFSEVAIAESEHPS